MMGVETEAVCMIGKYFESMDAAVEFLKNKGYLTETEAENSLYDGELPKKFELSYRDISCYSNEGGYVGVEIGYSTPLHRISEISKTTKRILGDDDSVGIHNFVYWY
jgi:hypothetical protein